jgi:hypothetical protein
MQIVESAIEKLKLISGQKGDVVNKKIHAITEKMRDIILILKQSMT